MPRLPRVLLPNYPHHIIQRGNNRQAMYFCEQDYLIYLEKLNEYSEKFNIQVHSYVFMTNHVHLLLTPRTRSRISELMQALGRYYVRYINGAYQRTGSFLDGRFKSSVVCSEQYLLTVMKYIELNPVRANMVTTPIDYPWTSFHHNASGKTDKLIKPHPMYLSLASEKGARLSAYRGLFETDLPETILTGIREASDRCLVLGNVRFKQQIEETLKRKIEPGQHGGDRRSKRYRSSLATP